MTGPPEKYVPKNVVSPPPPPPPPPLAQGTFFEKNVFPPAERRRGRTLTLCIH